MRHWLLLIIMLPLASAAAGDAPSATFDLFQDLDLSTMEADTVCGALGTGPTAEAGRITIADDAIRFEEGNGSLVPAEGPEQRTACAAARFVVNVPDGSSHMHVRFDADRRVSQQVTLSYNMPQRLVVLDAGGRTIHSADYFAPEEESRDRTRITQVGPEGDLIPLPDGTRTLVLAWVFQDAGQEVQEVPTMLGSGQSFSATVWDPWLEFSGSPAPITSVHEAADRQGRHLDREHQVHVRVDPPIAKEYAPNLRVDVDPAWTLVDVQTPQGSIRNFGGFEPDEEYTSATDQVKLRTTSEYLQVFVPGQVVRQHGAGEYVLVFSENVVLQEQPGMVVFNTAVILLPLLFAVVAVRRIWLFKKEAFGEYELTASKLLWALAFLGLYYIVVVAGAIEAGWFASASTLPIGADALLLYLQLALALVGATFIHAAARHLHRIVRPA